MKLKILAVLVSVVLIIPATLMGCSSEPVESGADLPEVSSIVGCWIAETDAYEIQYHFHEDGHYHAHTEFHIDGDHAHEHMEAEEADTFADGTYEVSGNNVTITVDKRITDCESEEFKKEIDEIREINFTFEFAEDGESWTASVENFGNVHFVKDVETEDWVQEHMEH